MLATNLEQVDSTALSRARTEPMESEWIAETVQRLAPGQQYIRGLFSGGTFCYEAALLFDEAFGGAFSNIATDPDHMLDDVWRSQGHTLLDLGDDLFTRGRPHPMIDHRLRNQRIVQEADDSAVAVLLLDIVLGYGSHPDPAAEMVPAIVEAVDLAAADNRTLVVIGWICGTDGDPQQLDKQQRAFEEAGVKIVNSSTESIRLAVELAKTID